MSLSKPDFESEENHSLAFDVPEVSDKVVFGKCLYFQYFAVVSMFQ